VGTGSFAHRTQEVHFWGFPVINGEVPTALSAFLKKPDRDTVFTDPSNFIVPIEQARTDLKRFEMVIDWVWQVALRELNDLKKTRTATTTPKTPEVATQPQPRSPLRSVPRRLPHLVKREVRR